MNHDKLILQNHLIMLEVLNTLVEKDSSLKKCLMIQFQKTAEALNPKESDSKKRVNKAVEEKQ